jgi:hypothetical protein
MLQRVSVAVGAGLAAALLFAVMAKGTPAAMLLSRFAPLPIMIATLGWGFDMGALAGAIATVCAAALLDPATGALFAASVALPAWALSFAAALPRGRLSGRAPGEGEARWFPVGGVVGLAALVGALAGAAAMASVVVSYGSFGKGVASIAGQMAPPLKEALDGAQALPGGVSLDEALAIAVGLLPALLAAATCLIFCANLYAGARAVQLSQRLARPWPDLPESLVLPRYLGIGLVACAALALSLRGSAAAVVWIGVGALGSAYVMQGLAVVHALSRGFTVRIPALVAFYIMCLPTALWALPALAILGLAESLLSLRARRAAAAGANPEAKSQGEKKWK